MHSTSKPCRRGAVHPVVVGALIVALLVAVSLGYQSGIEDRYLTHLHSISDGDRAAQERLTSCLKSRADLTAQQAAGDPEAEAAAARLQEMRDHLKAVVLDVERQDLRLQSCENDVAAYEARAAEQRSSYEATRGEFAALEGNLTALRASLEATVDGDVGAAQLAGEDRRVRPRRFMAAYQAACARLPGCLTATVEDLLTEKGEGEGTAGDDDVAQFVAMLHSSRDRSEAATTAEMPEPLTPSSPGFAALDLLASSVSPQEPGTIVACPVGEGKEEVEGMGAGRMRGGVPLFELLDYAGGLALCAWRGGRADLWMPSSFHLRYGTDEDPPWEAGRAAAPSQLHTLVESPLLRFCEADADAVAVPLPEGCAPAGATAAALYGGADFWAARSRLRPTPAIVADARDYYGAAEALAGPTLAVVAYPSSGDTPCEEAVKKGRGLHYLYLRRAFPSDGALTENSTTDLFRQCAPSAEDIAAYVLRLEAAAGKPFALVYLATPPAMLAQVRALLAAKATGDTRRIRGMDAVANAADPARAAMLALEIASSATAIAVSPYSATSRLVTERFLILNTLQASGKIHFF